MVNNVAITTVTLGATLSDITTFDSGSNVTILTGELGVGCLVFDPIGTLGVITAYSDTDNFIVKTYALSMDVNSILALDY